MTNVAIIVGNLVRDPEPAGAEGQVTKLRVAVNTRRKQGEEWVEEPNYFNVTAFGKLAEIAGEYLEKGRQVAVQGRLHWNAWEKDGEKREAVEIIANQIQFLTPPKEEADPEDPPEGGASDPPGF